MERVRIEVSESQVLTLDGASFRYFPLSIFIFLFFRSSSESFFLFFVEGTEEEEEEGDLVFEQK